jgi:regulator of PEP synthase PpsR (kinase-PPPase family)
MPATAWYLENNRAEAVDREDTMDDPKKIIILSDGTGKTAKRLMDAVLAQYSQYALDYTVENTYQEVRDKKTIDDILKTIDDSYLVIFSIISEELDKYFHEQLQKMEILHLNILRPMLITMSKFLGVRPDYRPGILHVVDDKYYKKVDAIGYTVEHDDGGGSKIENADIILLGLSRTCKTPISMYLACNFGVKVANIPIVNDDIITRNIMRSLRPLDQKKILGLMMHPEVLAHAREERSMFMAGAAADTEQVSKYYDLTEVRKEYRYCRELFERKEYDTVDVTRRAIEEVSLEILDKRGIINGDETWLSSNGRG